MIENSGTNESETLVSTGWLQERLNNEHLRLFDATYFLVDKTRDGRQECLDEHIAGCQFFDISMIADTASAWPNTVPAADVFQDKARELGVCREDQIVAYDRLGLFSAARVWWLFRYFGHRKVAVLDGGLPKWLAEGRPVENTAVKFPRGDFIASENAQLLRHAEQVLAISKTASEQIVDARAAKRFKGEAPEPRAGLRSGHIPGSVNLPFDRLLNEDSTYKSAAQIREEFATAGVDIERPVTTTCGSGVTACILSLGLQLAGQNEGAMFDGSWTEWGSREEFPIANGPPEKRGTPDKEGENPRG